MKFYYFFLFLLIACTGDDGNEPIEERSALETVAQTPNTWQFILHDDMYSRNGENTGYLASLNPESNKLIVYLEGGGACFNAATCDDNRNSFGVNSGNNYANEFNTNAPSILFARNIEQNPFKDWNYIYVPYSTGDVHSGGNNDADVPTGGPQNQKMNGFENFKAMADDLKEHYGVLGITEFIVAGSSAGGYGTYLNFDQVAMRFPAAKMTAVVDAAPLFFDESVFDNCLAEVWDDLFKFQYPSDFDNYVINTYDQKVQGVYEYLSRKYPEANFALISDIHDEVIRYFFGFGINACDGSISLIPNEQFYNGLLNIEQHLNPFSNWHVYYTPGNEHTFLGNTRVLTTTVNGVNLALWLEQVRAGTAVDVIP